MTSTCIGACDFGPSFYGTAHFELDQLETALPRWCSIHRRFTVFCSTHGRWTSSCCALAQGSQSRARARSELGHRCRSVDRQGGQIAPQPRSWRLLQADPFAPPGAGEPGCVHLTQSRCEAARSPENCSPSSRSPTSARATARACAPASCRRALSPTQSPFGTRSRSTSPSA